MEEYKEFDQNSLKNLLYDEDKHSWKIKIVKNKNSTNIFENFHYFNPQNLIDSFQDPKYIIAFGEGFSEIKGVLEYQKYDSNIGINYIDVHKNFKNQKIATNLLGKLNEMRLPFKKIKLSFLSEEGLKCGISNTAKRMLSNYQVID